MEDLNKPQDLSKNPFFALRCDMALRVIADAYPDNFPHLPRYGGKCVRQRYYSQVGTIIFGGESVQIYHPACLPSVARFVVGIADLDKIRVVPDENFPVSLVPYLEDVQIRLNDFYTPGLQQLLREQVDAAFQKALG